MSGEFALQLMSEMLWTGVLIAAPILAFTLLTGLLVSIFQVITQIQEMSLTFIPKILVVLATLAAFGPWMLRKLLGFATAVIANIPAYF